MEQMHSGICEIGLFHTKTNMFNHGANNALGGVFGKV